MASISIIGSGSMGQAIKSVFDKGGHGVEFVGRDASQPVNGQIVVLAVPYPAVAEILAERAGQLAGKVVVDITNPVDFATFDSLVVPADSSAAALIQAQLPESAVVKAFNTNFGSTLSVGRVGELATTVLVAGDDEAAKAALLDAVRAGGLSALDAGSLKRARELEAIGFLQITLAARELVAWTGGFGVV